MATRTSTASGNLSAGATWVGGVAPVAGDNIIVASGTVVTVDVSISLTAAGAADAVQINGASSASYGELIVPDGITLTLVGVDLVNQQLMQIQRYGKLTMQPGSTIVGDSPGDFTTQIDNQGRIYAIGTANKHITFTSPAANYSWNTSVSGEASSFGVLHKYAAYANICAISLTYPWISNSGGTGLGSFGDTSLSFSAVSPNAGPNGPICQTEKSSYAAVTAVGDYYVDYRLGIVYFYQPSGSTNTSFTADYKRLSFSKGWGITSIQNNTYNEALFDYCDFSYMGKTSFTTNQCVVALRNKQSASVAADRLAYIKHCTFTYCMNPVQLIDLTGTDGDRVKFTYNTMVACGVSSTSPGALSLYRGGLSYVDITNNTLEVAGTVIGTSTLSPVTYTGINIDDNVFTTRDSVNTTGGGGMITNAKTVTWSATNVRRNTFYGSQSVSTATSVENLVGISSGDRVLIEGNAFVNCYHAISIGSYTTFRKNTILYSYHHNITPATDDYSICTTVDVYNNLIYGEALAADAHYDGCTSIETGYFWGIRTDNWNIYNNTICGNPNGAFGFGQLEGSSGNNTLITRLRVVNNLCVIGTGTSATCWKRQADSTSILTKAHVIQWDNNLDYNHATRYGTGLQNQGTFSFGDGINYNDDDAIVRNVTGVALFNPSFSSLDDGRLYFVYTSSTDMTLAWKSGTPVQLVFGGAGTSFEVSSIGTAGTNYEVVNVTGTPFNTSENNAACPVLRWLVWLNGAAAGDVFHVSDSASTSQIKITPRFGSGRAAVAGDDFVLIESEVTLADGAESLKAGIYFPDLPTSTKSDTGIYFDNHSITGSDPLLVDNDSNSATGYYLASGSSPAIGAATTVLVPSDDYAGTARDGSPDIGFYEYVAPSAPASSRQPTFVSRRSRRLYIGG